MSSTGGRFPVLALVIVTAIWGWTFVVVQDAVASYPVLPFLAIRFGIAALALTPAAFRSGKGVTAGFMPGALLALGYLTQTVGLQYTTASKAGLLTGLFVVITPLLAFCFHRQRPAAWTMAAVGAALGGTILLASPGSSGAKSSELLGDGLEVLTAILFSLHILVLARLDKSNAASRVALGQMLTAFCLFSVASVGSGGFPRPSPAVWGAIAVTGLLASALAFWVQTYVQQRISAARVALILVCEPAFAMMAGLVLAGDRFSAIQAAGAGIVLVALAFHEALSPQMTPASRAAGS